MTLLALSFHSTLLNITRSCWQAEKREKEQKKDSEALRELQVGSRGIEGYDGGAFVLFDWEKNQVIWQIDIDAAAGFCLHEGRLFINRLRAGEILVLDGYGRETRRISHKQLNDLHTIVPTKRGFLLTSTGTDSILEIDQEGRLLYEWCALDHGYPYLPDELPPIERHLDRSLDQRYMIYETSMHTTHVNSACFADTDEEVILATLFHQGTLISIDRTSGQSRTLFGDLFHPHDIRPYGAHHWLLSDTAHNQTLILNEQWEVTQRIDLDCNWIQSSAPLQDGSIVIADTNNHRLVRVYPDGIRPSEVRPFPTEWRIFLVNEVLDADKDFFQHPIATPFL